MAAPVLHGHCTIVTAWYSHGHGAYANISRFLNDTEEAFRCPVR
jgi:hypothetical protein